MSLTKKAHENAVTSIADTDLVMVVGPNGGLHPISFSNLAKLVRNSIKIGGRNLLKNTGSLVVSGSNPVWLNSRFAVAGAVLKAEGGPLVFSCKYRKTGNPEGIVQLGMIVTTSNYDQQSWNASSLLSHGKLVKVFSRDDSFEDGSSFSLFALSIAGIELYDLKLERGNIATDWTPAPEDIASGLWGGVIGYLPITYNFGEKGGAHDDESSFGRAEISADCHLAFGSLDAACEFIGRACEVNERFTNSNVSSMRGCGYCISRLDEDRCIYSASSKRRQRRVHSYSLLRRSCKNAILLPVPVSSGDLGKAPNFRGRLGELESVIAYGKEVTYAD